MTWRMQADAVIRRIVAAHPTADERELRRLISAAYPFGERANYPYQAWLSQVRAYLDMRFPGRRLPRQKALGVLPLFRRERATNQVRGEV